MVQQEEDAGESCKMLDAESPKEPMDVPCSRIIVLILLSAIPIAMICMGAIFQCPLEPWIANFMIIAGCMMLVGILLAVYTLVRGSIENTYVHIFGGVLLLFFFCVVVAGSGWVFGEMGRWSRSRQEVSLVTCHPGLYLFACVFLVVVWVVSLVTLVVKGRKFDCLHVQD